MSSKKIKRPRETANIEFVEKKSVFIGFSTFVENEEQALEIIKQKKKEYHDASPEFCKLINDFCLKDDKSIKDYIIKLSN